jgi:Flp pilus assembly protein TadD
MYHQFGLAKEALECARLAHAAKADDPDALVALGNACDLAGRRDEAVRWFKRAAEMARSHDLVPFGSLAFCLFNAGDRDGARQALEQALQRALSSADHAQLDKISHLIVDLLEPARALAVCDKITADLP